MQKSSWIPIVVIPIVVVIAVVAGRFFYYGSNANAYVPPERERADVSLEAAPRSARIDAVDNPTVSKGVVAVDYGHSNALFVEELNVLLSKIVARGFSYEILTGAEEEEDKLQALSDTLRYARALILPLPRDEYTSEEISEIERFVEKGGELLIIGDPTRTVDVEGLNSVAGSFGIIFANDYLYSLENNDNNYRNVIYTEFKDSPLTAGLAEGDKIIFYASNSVKAPGQEIILGDETTESSISEGGRTNSPAVLTTNEQVLALGDLTFFGEPYSAAEKNETLINNIANFLTDTQRDFSLKDFPYFFETNVDIVFDDTLVFNSQFGDSVALKEFLEEVDRNVTFTDKIGDSNNDVIFVGRFEDIEPVESFLTEANISILGPDKLDEAEELTQAERERFIHTLDATAGEEERFVGGRIHIEGIGDLERGGSTLFYLHQEDDRNVLIILSDSPDTNADAFELLLDNELAECLASPQIAVCQTEEPDEQLPPSLRSVRIDKILVVSDDDGREREAAQTGLADYRNVLSDTYQIEAWVTADSGSPDIDELLEYDAIIWTTGNYWDDSIGEEDVALLSKYIEVGGNLILSGASIAFDWDHTDFLTNVAHADYLDFAVQSDLSLAMPDHAIADDFEEGTVITFLETGSEEPLEPDVVSHTPNARVIFERGPNSEQAGAASVIAYEDERAKIAYYAFPVYLLPPEEQALLINNTVDWFTRKPLDLPDVDEFESFEEDETAEEEPAEDETGGEGDEGGNGGDETENSEG